jgi:hypothetical protein
MKYLVARAFLISAGSAALGMAEPIQAQSPEPSPPSTALVQSPSESNLFDSALIGTWTIDVDATADVLARAQFGTRQEIIIKRGAAHPETNMVTRAFDQGKYDEIRDFWTQNLNRPEMEWRIILKRDHTGEFHGSAEDDSTPRPRSIEVKPGWEQSIKYKPVVEPIEWKVNGAELWLEYPAAPRFKERIARIASTNEWHYPMQPLGGWFVMRPAKAASHP